jgi:hypothetical protein
MFFFDKSKFTNYKILTNNIINVKDTMVLQ